MVLFFLHGAGGHDEDRTLADAIAAELGLPLEYPHLPEDDMSVEHQALRAGSPRSRRSR
ncbi:hypothetical protein [Microbacterium invictum]|uniref:Uncharacterized protein n=1 Tax=Microbacterium invictum TaxID=515415 RepID=A0ABZ0VFF4_9MICO|nr:hypothetical protein [Microbacterium invictum]WQB70522.1 hypothetical protein T9R20_00750 [Microbacterium invictum]